MVGRADYYARQDRRRERLEERAEKARAKAATEFRKADLREEVSGIPFGQPILVGHHSEGRHRRAIERADNAMRRAIDADRKADRLEARAESVGKTGRGGSIISSDNPDALDLLRDKRDELEKLQATMIAANKLIRKGDREGIAAMGLPMSLFEPDFCGRVGFPDYALSNNRAEIRRTEARIKQLEASEGAETKEIRHNSGVTLVENVEANRVQLIFPEKPSAEVRGRLKRAGFRWSRSEGAWQRHLNNAGRYAAQTILESLC